MPKFEDERFKPPAPVASVSFTNPKNEKSVVDVLLLIDTGAPTFQSYRNRLFQTSKLKIYQVRNIKRFLSMEQSVTTAPSIWK